MPSPYRRRINGEALRAIRLALGLSVVKVAQDNGLSHSFVSNLEAGRRQASPAVARQLADYLGVSVRAITDAGAEVSAATTPKPDNAA